MATDYNEYMRIYMARRRADRRGRLLEMSGGSCARCASTEELEFNHLDRETKLFDLSLKGMDRSWSFILLEWEKCELLCKSCHLDYTRKQWAEGQIVPWNKGLRGVELVCGTARCYSEKPCRCGQCRAAKRAYRNKEIDYHSPVAQ